MIKRLLITLLSIFLLVPLVGTFKHSIIQAQDLSSCGYEVAYINDDGSFTTESCHGGFDSAKSRMKELGGDYVVRHNASYSPTKIIAMNSGVVYAYPRDGSTIDIYEEVENHSIYRKQTYVARHDELVYTDTERYFDSGSLAGKGMIEVYINGFHGYTDLEYVDLVPSKFLRNGIRITLGGNNNYTHEGTFTVVPIQNYYIAKTTNNYKEMIYYRHDGWSANGSDPVSESIVCGPAPSDMQEGVKYYSYDGTTFFTNSNYTNIAFTYYNYYQYLPLRSKTNISADVLNSYVSNVSNSVLKGTGQNFVDAQNKYGINALLLFAMACHESGNGTSSYATSRYNLFGWNAVDADPNQASYFSSVADCINEQAGINLRGYVDITDGRFFSSSLGNKGSGLNVKYASDPWWGMEIAGIAYQIDKLSKNKNGSLTDYNYYSLSLITDFDVEVKASANANSNTLYTTAYGPTYQKDFIVITLAEEGEYTKIQSTNPIDSNGNIKTHRTPITTGNLNPISYGEYDFNLSVGYIKTSSLSVLNKKTNNKIDVVDDDLSLLFNIEDLSVSDNKLTLSGNAFIKGMSATDASKITDTVTVINHLDGTSKAYMANVTEYKGISFNDNHTYTYVGFNVSIPIKDFAEGDYYFTITVENNGYNFSKTIYSYADFAKNFVYTDSDYTYHIRINSTYGNRLDFSVESIPTVIDYSAIKKPNNNIRNSLMSLDKLTLDDSLNLYLDGQAMLYYVDYGDLSSIKTTLYLVDSANNFIEIAGENYKSSFDYTKAFSSSYNLDYISYKINGNISDLKEGTYMLIMKLENGDYVDYVEVNNINSVSLPSITYNGLTYRFFTSNTRSKLMLEVK